jgi:hypothetical protein
VPGRRAGGEGERDGDRAGRQASAGDRPFHRGLLSPWRAICSKRAYVFRGGLN